MDAEPTRNPPAPLDVALERMARPLLELLQRVTGLETTFITDIDWERQRQKVVVALNTAELVIAEGTELDWTDSMCRWVFLDGTERSHDVRADFPGSIGADQLGLHTFVAVPILVDDNPIATVCGASRRIAPVTDDTLALVRLAGDAIAYQMEALHEARSQLRRAERAEAAVRAAEAVNDNFGHEAGDTVLRALADAIRVSTRRDDLVGRVGGDEFVVAGTFTGEGGGSRLAQRIRTHFATLTREGGTPCTLSIGLVSSDSTPRHDLLAAADRALYRAKATGRDTVALPPP